MAATSPERQTERTTPQSTVSTKVNECATPGRENLAKTDGKGCDVPPLSLTGANNAKSGEANAATGEAKAKPGDANAATGGAKDKPVEANAKSGEANAATGDAKAKPVDPKFKVHDQSLKPLDKLSVNEAMNTLNGNDGAQDKAINYLDPKSADFAKRAAEVTARMKDPLGKFEKSDVDKWEKAVAAAVPGKAGDQAPNHDAKFEPNRLQTMKEFDQKMNEKLKRPVSDTATPARSSPKPPPH